MNNILFASSSGSLAINTVTIAPKSLSEIRDAFSCLGLVVREMHPTSDLVSFALSGEFHGEQFGIYITYKGEELYSAWLAWDGGITRKKGYETTEKELLVDKNQLSRLFSKIIGKSPDVKEYTHDAFHFPWGRVSIAASLRATIVSIGFHWNSGTRNAAD